MLEGLIVDWSVLNQERGVNGKRKLEEMGIKKIRKGGNFKI
jgi:hypothetical protein